MSSLPDDQHMARVCLPEDRWSEFVELAARNKRSIGTYLGHLVAKELRRAERAEWKKSLAIVDDTEAPGVGRS